ncbi:transposon Tf2-9 polyprotein [Trichonephila clavipes]|nr:transposon Tf2-9 polyprotein [Trichonephila clavipes]
MDDIIIPSSDELDGLNRLTRVLKTASEYGLELNLKKCNFLKSKIEFLGHIIETVQNTQFNDFTKRSDDAVSTPDRNSPLVSMEVPLRTAYGQNGCCGMQPKATQSCARRRIELKMKTKTLGHWSRIREKKENARGARAGVTF